MSRNLMADECSVATCSKRGARSQFSVAVKLSLIASTFNTPIHAQPVQTLTVGAVVVRVASQGDKTIDSVVSRNGGDLDIVRTRYDASGNVVLRERRLRRTGSAGLLERTASAEMVLRPRITPRLNESYPCGYIEAVTISCTALGTEMITTPVGRFAASRVLMSTRSANAAFVELWIDDDVGVLRSRGRSDNADQDLDIVEIRSPASRRAAATSPVAVAPAVQFAPVTSIPSENSGYERQRGAFLSVGGGLATRRTQVSAVSHKGHDSGISASVLMGSFVSPHVAVLLAVDGYRNASAGDKSDAGFVVYPTPRYENMLVAGPSVMLSAGRYGGLFLRIGGGIALTRSHLYTVANRRVVGGFDYQGTSVGYNAALGVVLPLGSHASMTPYVSAVAVPNIDVRQRGTNALAFPASRHVALSAGMSLGLR